MVLFGAVSTYLLLKKQAELNRSIVSLSKELQDNKEALSQATDQINEGNLLRVQLQDELEGYKSKLSKAEKKLDQFREYARLIRTRMDNAAEMNEALASRNRDINSKLIRAELENQELRQKFEDPTFLKQALRELGAGQKKTPVRPAPKNQPARKPVVKKKAVTRTFQRVLMLPQDQRRVLPAQPQPAAPVDGNAGFMVRDGQSTVQGVVDIRVLPAEPTAVKS